MEPWIWLIVIAVAAVGIYFWRQVQEGLEGAREIEASGSLGESIVQDLLRSGEVPADATGENALVYGVLFLEQGNTDAAVKAFRRGKELGNEEASLQLDQLLKAQSADPA